MTINQLAFNTLPRADYSTVQHSKPNDQSFASALDRAKDSTTHRNYEAREVLRMLQDCMLGLLAGQEEEMDMLSSYNFVRPFTNAGYDAYRAAAMPSSAPVYADQSPSAAVPVESSAPTDFQTVVEANPVIQTNPVDVSAVEIVPIVAQAVQPAPSQSMTLRENIENLIDQVAQRVGLPASLIRSVVSTESSYRHDAVSPVGAQGLMQLMPGTAAELGVEDSFDPQQNLMGGSRYLKGLLKKYDGDLDHALAAYNWGQGNVDRKGLERMPTETRNYIAKVKLATTQLG